MAMVLLVEDVPLVRETLRKFLERGGHAVTACASGSEAKMLLGRTRPDAVVTDLWMRDGDGLSLIRALCSGGRPIPVVAITGGDPRSPQASSADEATEAGADLVLLKPVTKDELLGALTHVLRSQHANIAENAQP